MASIPLPALATRTDQPSPIDTYSKLLAIRQAQAQSQLIPGQLQGQQQQLQMGQQEIQKNQMALTDQQASTKAMQQWDGKDVNELPGLILKNGGSANAVFSSKKQILEFQQSTANLSKDQLANEKTKNDFFAQQIDTVKNLPPDQQPQAFEQAKQAAVQAGHLDPQQAQQMQYQGPQQLDILEKTLMGRAAVAAQAEKQATEAETHRHNLADEQKVPLDQQEAKSWLANNPGKTLDDFAKWKAALSPTATFNLQSGAGGGLNDTAIDQAAERYATTGQLPPTARGAAGLAQSRQIMNRAAELHPAGNISANSAEYKANQSSLQGLQKNFDQVTAFENTAGKNLDQFLSVAKKVVDSGSPWINSPLRTVGQQGLGSADLAAFNAARTTAVTEIAKVLNSSNASGVLSDSARSEVQQLIGPNASLKQIVGAANILKKDMSNRHDAYQEQISDIKYRLGGSSGSSGKVVITAPDGSQHPFDTQEQANKFKQLAGIK